MSEEIEISYGKEHCFFISSGAEYFPPSDRFLNLLNAEERDCCELIWYLSLFHKFGMIPTKPVLFNGFGIWTSYYEFEIRGISCMLIYDDEYEMVNNFYADGDAEDRKEAAEALRDLIAREGSGVTYEDWLALRNS